MHDPGKTVLDLAVAVALGGTAWPMWRWCAPSRSFGSVVSDPAVSRLIGALAEDSAASISAIRQARAAARVKVWSHRTRLCSPQRASGIPIGPDRVAR